MKLTLGVIVPEFLARNSKLMHVFSLQSSVFSLSRGGQSMQDKNNVYMAVFMQKRNIKHVMIELTAFSTSAAKILYFVEDERL